MEQGLERHRASPHLGQLAAYGLDRAGAIEADLDLLCGARSSQHIPLLAAGEFYAGRIAKAAEGDGARLIAHAYARYLGDLSGGQILHRLLARSLQLRPSELAFYDFPRFSDLEALKTDYRQALDRAGALSPDADAIVEEGALAFCTTSPCHARCRPRWRTDRPRPNRTRRRKSYFPVLSPPDVRDECQIRCSSTSAVRNVELRTLSSISAIRPVSTP